MADTNSTSIYKDKASFKKNKDMFKNGIDIDSIKKMLGKMEDVKRMSKVPVDEKERPCRQCKRKNDVGVDECWYCGISSPVQE